MCFQKLQEEPRWLAELSVSWVSKPEETKSPDVEYSWAVTGKLQTVKES